MEEAEKYDVLPLDDRLPVEILMDPRPQGEPPRETYVYYPGTAEVPEAAAVNIRGRSYRILAEVEITTPEAEGVIFAHGSRFGGHALFLKDRRLHYVYNFLGIAPEQDFVVGVARAGPLRARHGVQEGVARRARRVARHDAPVCRRRRRRRGSDARAAGVLRAVRRRPLRRPRLERPGEQPVPRAGDVHGRHDQAGRGQRRRRPVPRPRAGGDGGPRRASDVPVAPRLSLGVAAGRPHRRADGLGGAGPGVARLRVDRRASRRWSACTRRRRRWSSTRCSAARATCRRPDVGHRGAVGGRGGDLRHRAAASGR